MAGKKETEEQEQRSLEENFSEVEELIGTAGSRGYLSGGSFTAYSKGMNVLKQCNEQIDRVEKQVMKLNEEGGLEPAGSPVSISIPAGRGRLALDMEETLFRQELQKRTAAIEELLKEYLPAEEGYQKTVIEAMNYSLMAGGKRLRPMLMQETYKMFGGKDDIDRAFMAAIEMIHTYSLVHDDLPAMDNDEVPQRPQDHLVCVR